MDVEPSPKDHAYDATPDHVSVAAAPYVRAFALVPVAGTESWVTTGAAVSRTVTSTREGAVATRSGTTTSPASSTAILKTALVTVPGVRSGLPVHGPSAGRRAACTTG